MIPVGAIARAYADGSLDDDAAVALTMGPEEFGHMSFVEPLVDVWPTITALRKAGKVTDAEVAALRKAAQEMFFQKQSVSGLIAAVFDEPRRASMEEEYMRHRVSAKAYDALELVATLKLSRADRSPSQNSC